MENVVENFNKIIQVFSEDLVRTFPELRDSLLHGMGNAYDFCKSVYPEHFFNILYKNEEMFEKPIELLPGINFSILWHSNISDNTKTVIWKYLQLILFTVVQDTNIADTFGDAAKLFEAIDENEFSAKIEETFNEFMPKDDAEDLSGHLPRQEDLENHLKGIFSGKIGALAKDIAEEVASEFDLDMSNITNTKDVFKKLIKNPKKLLELTKKIGDKLDSKIKSGEIKESELLEEASQFMDNMRGTEGMKDILSKFGLNKMSGAQSGAMKSEMNRRITKTKQQERMREKLEKRNLEKARKLLEEQKNKK